MAVMIPGNETRDDFNDSPGELKLYNVLRELPDNYYIFHSTQWNEERKRKMSWTNKEYRHLVWGECDFLVFNPSKGLIFFEVKGGEIHLSPKDGWVQENRNSHGTKTIDPMEQANRSMRFFRKLLEDYYADGSVPYGVECAVWFTDCDPKDTIGSYPQNYKEDLVLWSRDLSSTQSAQKAINSIFDKYFDEVPVPDDDTTKIVLDLLCPSFGCFRGARSKALSDKELFKRMTVEQTYLLDYLDEQEEAAIHGVAGTGKTVLARLKAERLAADGDKVLFLCFNSLLKDYLVSEISSSGVDVYDIDGFYTSRVRHRPSSERTEWVNDVFEFLADLDSFNTNYKHIVVDEGQDFADIHLQALRAYTKSKNGCFYVFYDRNQFCQGDRFPDWLNEMDCRLVLSRNCRNSKEIAITSTRTIGLDISKVKMRRENAYSSLAPNKPAIFFSKDEQDFKIKLIRLFHKYTSAGISKKDIVVLSFKGTGKSVIDNIYGDRTNATDSAIPLDPTYRLTTAKNDRDILFTTVRKFKGLEADVVICIDIDEQTFQDEVNRNLFYIGTSRARSFLDIISLASAPSMATAILGKEVSGPYAIKAISDGLEVKIGTESDFNA